MKMFFDHDTSLRKCNLTCKMLYSTASNKFCNAYSSAVRISAPSLKIATVCSKCAERLPSAVT